MDVNAYIELYTDNLSNYSYNSDIENYHNDFSNEN